MVRVAAALFALALVPAAVHAQPGQRVHAVIVVDTNSNLKGHLLKTQEELKTLLTSGLAPVLNLTTVSGDGVTSASIRRTITDLPVGPDDTLFFFIGCHGVTSRDRHGFQLTGPAGGKEEFVTRDSVRQLLLAKGARLTVFLSDSCSNVNNDVSLKDIPPEEGPKAFGETVLPLYRKLFLESRGLVDFNSSHRPDLSWSFPNHGPVFPYALRVTFEQLKEQKNATWLDFYEAVKVNTQETFVKWKDEFVRRNEPELKETDKDTFALLKGQKRQTTQAHHMPGMRLKFMAETTNGHGARVTEVFDDSPAKKTPAEAGLMIGDVIVAVNGIPVAALADMPGAVGRVFADAKDSPAAFAFRVNRNGKMMDISVTVPKP